MDKQKKIIIGLLAVIIVCIIIVVGNMPEAPNTSSVQDKAIEAFFASQEFVKKQLKAPATTKFPDPSQARVLIGENSHYRVISYVDAQNSFGALIRSHYECLLRYDSGQDKWFPVSVEINK